MVVLGARLAALSTLAVALSIYASDSASSGVPTTSAPTSGASNTTIPTTLTSYETETSEFYFVDVTQFVSFFGGIRPWLDIFGYYFLPPTTYRYPPHISHVLEIYHRSTYASSRYL